MKRVYCYFENEHNRYGYDNNHGIIKNVIRPIGYEDNNAEWMGNGIFKYGQGDGSNYDPWVSLDICAREFVHALIDNTARFNHNSPFYEAFADIFATVVEFYVDYNRNPDYREGFIISPNWTIGEDVVKTGLKYLRSLQNPKSNYHATKYHGNYFSSGKYQASTVLSHAFYLMVNGGAGDNEGIQYNVPQIPGSSVWERVEKVADIFYYVLTNVNDR